MPFTGSPIEHPAFKALGRLRDNVAAGFGIAIVCVSLAFLARLALNDGAVGPFITFYPAIIISAFLGGLGPGVLAAILSTLLAWYFFLAPEWSWALGEKQIVALLIFAAVNAVNVSLVLILNGALVRVLAREQETRMLIETAPNGVIVADEKGTIALVNATAEKLFGYTRSELIGKSIEALVPGRLMTKHQSLRAGYMEAPITRAMGVGRDLKARRKDGSEFPVEIGLNALRRDGKYVVLATVVDISERHKLTDQQHLLTRELYHRTQNLFAVVQSVFNRTFREDTQLKQLFLKRLKALAAANAMIADAAWEGVRLDQLLRTELAAFTDRAAVSGCDLLLNPTVAQSFALIVHELATNASKYGALSVPTGNVTVVGTRERSSGQDIFRLRWSEQNGPEVNGPDRRGFGSTMLIDAAKGFGGKANIEFGREGLRYELAVRLAAIEARPNRA